MFSTRPELRLVAFACPLLLAGAPAPNAPLDAAALRAELFGTHLYGIETGSGAKWDECIEPSGRTVFRVILPFGQAPYSEPGQLVVTEDAQACFSYPPQGDPEPACFRALRRGEGYIFISVEGEGTFLTTRIERGKATCPAPGELIG